MSGLLCSTSRVGSYGGRPALFINDRPVPAAMVYVEPRYVNDFAARGLHIHNAEFGGVRWWLGPEEFDFAAVDRRVCDFLDADDQALLLPRIPFGYAEAGWWRGRYPEEVSVARSIETGEVVQRFGEAASHRGSGHSFASDVWLREASAALDALVQHMEASDYAGHVIGYHIGGGITTEWFAWNTFHHDLCEDYSQAMAARLRAWLRERYGTAEALREAWDDSSAEFETAAAPEPRRIVGLGSPYLRQDRRALDYLECFSETTASAVERLTMAAKDACDWRKIVGVFFGYAWPHWNVVNPARSGHAAMRRVFELPSVDFVISPYHYENRAPGGYDGSQTLPDAIAARGKLYVHEIDPVTHLACARTTRWSNHVGVPRDASETVELLKRDFAAASSARAAYWWMDVTKLGWFDDPAIMQTFGRLKKVEDSLFARDWQSVAEVAVVFSPESCPRQRLLSPVPHWYLGVFRQFNLSRMGAPFDTILIDDLLAGRTRDYRLYVFPNAYYLTDADRLALRRLLVERRAWALWFHAPGYLSDTGAGLDRSSELTGIDLVLAPKGGTVTFGGSSDPLLRGIRTGDGYGMGRSMAKGWMARAAKRQPVLAPIEPVVAADDSDAVVLGLIDGASVPGLVVKRSDGRGDVFSFAPAPPWRFMRNLLDAAGVHVWCRTGDVVYADARFAALHAASTGRKTLRLPAISRATDLWNGDLIGKAVSAVRLDMRRGQTVLVGIE